MEENKIVALVVDDHPLFLNGLKNVLLKTHRFSKIYEATNGQEAIDTVEKHPEIDLIFLDIEMPILNGVEASKILLKNFPSLKIIISTMFCEPKYIFQMIDSNVSGYILKDSKIEEIKKAVDMVLDNQTYYSAKVQNVIIAGYQNQKKGYSSDDISLTKSQTQVLLYLCQQYSNAEIAHELNVSELTVKRHRQDLLEKTNSKNLAGLIIFAIERGIYSVNNHFSKQQG
jgi:DNA-binding NarL/FixJ family response regulator